MAKNHDEDLFADTTMTFGEHLDELRISLGKSVLGLMVGFIVGLFIANRVVTWIQTPLTTALEQYYVDKAKEDLTEEYEEQGEELPGSVEEFIDKNRFVYEKLYVEVDEVERIGDLVDTPEDRATDETDSSRSDKIAVLDDNLLERHDKNKDGNVSREEWQGLEQLFDRMDQNGDGEITGEEFEAKMLQPRPSALVLTRIWRPINTVVQALSAQEAFMIWLKAAFVSGLIIASPYIFWQIWNFVAAGLYPHEKRYVHIYLPFSLLLFWAGAATAFFVVFEYVLNFLFAFNRGMNIDPDPRISEWLSFVLFLPLGFGIAYQLPLVMLFLHRIGIFSINAYLKKWRIAILIIFVASMLLTPADPVSMLMMATPMTALYFLGIALCKWMPRNKSPFSEAYEP